MAEKQRTVFHVSCEATKPGQYVHLVGNIQELGDWDWHKAPRMTTTKDTFPKWKVEVLIPRTKELQYKYVVAGFDSLPIIWEHFEGNRTLCAQYHPCSTEVLDGNFGTLCNLSPRALALTASPPAPSITVWMVRHCERLAFTDFPLWSRTVAQLPGISFTDTTIR